MRKKVTELDSTFKKGDLVKMKLDGQKCMVVGLPHRKGGRGGGVCINRYQVRFRDGKVYQTISVKPFEIEPF
jgi:translation elongation factor P/translation initiation factor 5A